ncbi:MAG: hypothetical protein K0R40_3188, partial [Burkholderiales bacterium]|nr:hypothetical protein [Burkholderiales bacterium]
MEERRRALWLALTTALACKSAAACVPPLEGTRLESPRFVLAFKPVPIAVAQHFSLDIGVCARSSAAIESVRVDAHMP